MLKIGDRLDSYTIAAGEPWIMSIQMRAHAGNAIIDWSQRRLVLSFYTADRALKVQIEGVYTSDASGAYFAFIRDGTFTENLFGEALQVELAERLLNGRAIIATGALSIVPSSQGVTTFGAVIGRAEARFTIYFSPAGLVALIEQEILPYDPPVVAPPVTLGNLSLSGTLRVGIASNGTIIGATDGSTITDAIAGLIVDSGARSYAYDGSGSAGTVAAGLTETHPNATNSPRHSAITVAAAPVVLAALSLAANSIIENTPSGTVVSGIIGKTEGSTLSFANDDGGRFAISGANLVAGLTNVDYEAASSRNIVLRETLAGAANSPRDTALAVGVVNVNEQPSLRALMLSSTSLTVGTPASGAVTEAATGSAITAGGLPAGFTVNGPARTWAYDGSGPASTPTITLIETLGDSPNSPRSTLIGLTVAAATATPAAFTMSQLAEPNRIYERDIIAGVPQTVGTIPVTMTVTTAGTVYARTRAVTAGNPVRSPSRKVLNNVATGTRAVAITGVPMSEDEFYLDLSPDGVTWSPGTVPVGMGMLVGYAGQSLMVAMFNRRTAGDTMAGAGETPTTMGRVLSEGGNWQGFTNSDAQGVINSAGANALIRLLAEREKCAVGLIGYAAGATDIAYWVPGSEGFAKLKASIDKAGNRIEAFIWMQGHSDSNKLSRGSYYRQQLSTMFAAIDAAVTDQTFIRYVATIPNISTTNWGSAYKKEAVRVAGERWCRENPRAVSVVMDDLDLMDGTHQSQRGSVETAVNFYRHMVNPATAIGATIGAVARNGAVLTVPLTLPAGATALAITSDLKTRLLVLPRGERDPSKSLAISTVAVGAAVGGVVTLTITLAAEPAEMDLDIIFNPKNDPTGDGSAIVLRNNLVGDGATYGRQVTAAVPARYAKARAVTLVESPAYAAGRWPGRQGLSAGSADATRALGVSAAGSTIEFWVRHNGAEGTIVFLYLAGGFFGFSGDDFNDNNSLISGAIPRNVWNHVAFTYDGGSLLIHVNGRLIKNSAATSEYPSAVPLGIRGFNNGGFRPAPGACTISDVAVWSQSRYETDTFAVPTAAYVGDEPFLDHLYRLDGNGADSVIRV